MAPPRATARRTPICMIPTVGDLGDYSKFCGPGIALRNAPPSGLTLPDRRKGSAPETITRYQPTGPARSGSSEFRNPAAPCLQRFPRGGCRSPFVTRVPSGRRARRIAPVSRALRLPNCVRSRRRVAQAGASHGPRDGERQVGSGMHLYIERHHDIIFRMSGRYFGWGSGNNDHRYPIQNANGRPPRRE